MLPRSKLIGCLVIYIYVYCIFNLLGFFNLLPGVLYAAMFRPFVGSLSKTPRC